jgi:predicted TIM-barrel fold metal-dependent hydrolase
MIDAHVHIGQFNQIWYDPDLVIKTVLQAGVERIVFTSTTSCKENVRYTEVEKEVEGVLSAYDSKNIKPLLWYNPNYHKQGLGIEKVMQSLPYAGIKIHPRAHNWDLSNKHTLSILEELFGYADQYQLPVLIHTGVDKIDEADKFGSYFPKYPKAKVVLAHCKPPHQVLQLLLENRNTFFDTSYVLEEDVYFFFLRGLSDRIILGSDFPTTHYRNRKEYNTEENLENDLMEQYKKDFQTLSDIQTKTEGRAGSNTGKMYFTTERESRKGGLVL